MIKRDDMSTKEFEAKIKREGSEVILTFKCEDHYGAMWLYDKLMIERGMTVRIKHLKEPVK